MMSSRKYCEGPVMKRKENPSLWEIATEAKRVKQEFYVTLWKLGLANIDDVVDVMLM